MKIAYIKSSFSVRDTRLSHKSGAVRAYATAKPACATQPCGCVSAPSRDGARPATPRASLLRDDWSALRAGSRPGSWLAIWTRTGGEEVGGFSDAGRVEGSDLQRAVD